MEQVENAPQKKKVKKGCLIGGIAALVVLILLIALIAGSGDSESEPQQGKTQTKSKVEAKKSPWTASEQTDEMSGDVFYFNETKSLNEIEFTFPYQGGSTFGLTVRGKAGQTPEVILTVSKGQFMTSLSGSEYLRLKFDEEEVIKVTYNSAADGSAETIFLNSTSMVLKKLAAAKKLKVEAPFFQDGRQIIEFDVDGFTWEH